MESSTPPIVSTEPVQVECQADRLKRNYSLFRSSHPDLLKWDAHEVIRDMERRITALEEHGESQR